jgi:signal transduction histidine kinase/CheY-like chemotaxis protein
MVFVQIFVILGCYLAGKFFPEKVTRFTSDFPRYFDIIQTILVSGLFTGVILKYQNRIYENEKNKAEAATRAKANFLANISHELRTPLNAIIGLGELELQKKLPEDTAVTLEKIYTSGRTLLSIINDLLDISKIESGSFELIPVEYQTPSLINDTINLNVVRIKSKPIDFIVDIDENFPFKLFGDELRIRQILNNLLSNAFKYTKEGKVRLKIRSEAFEEGKIWFVCTVEDTGIGIHEEDIEKLFTIYNQVDTKTNRHIEGTGLGLSICKNLVHLMGGSISVQSEYGKGSAFTVRFVQPLVDAAPIGPELSGDLAKFRFAAGKLERWKSFINPMPYGKILIVDDVAINLDVAKGMMLPYGIAIDCAESGREAIRLITEEKVKYDVVFMDHMMPLMDGIEAVRIIRNEIGSDYARTVPIIALTANALIGNDKMFFENGFQDYLTKPIDMAKLNTLLNKWVRNREKEEAPEWAALIKKMREEDAGESVPASAEDAAAKAPVPASGPLIPGLDFAGGLKRLGNREAAYIRILGSFSSGIPVLLDKIRDFKPEALGDYTITVHGIKGTCYGICADDAGRRAEELERAARNGDIEVILEKNNGFISQMEKLTADIAAYLASR